MPDLILTHTPASGTLVSGTQRGDAAGAVLKQRIYGPSGRLKFQFSRDLGCWYLPHSRDRDARRVSIDTAAAKLREAGFAVTVIVDDAQRRSFAAAKADRAERSQQRTQRLAERAGQTAARGAALREESRAMAARIPFGQPILADHYSANRDRNYRERMGRKMDQGIAQGEKAQELQRRSDASAQWKAFRDNPRITLRRIAQLEAQERGWLRRISGQDDMGEHFSAEEMQQHLADIQEQLEYWRAVVAEAEANGFKVWSREDFAKGDFTHYGGQWFEVVRVNPKTLTVPSFTSTRQPVATRQTSAGRHRTHTLPYDKVTGRRSPEEMAAALAEQSQQPEQDA
ncbi:DUF3560 domain-containing protein [Streptomyces minutiscleroticus]|uniref:DUF3560 domain-containing protein n=1 Tax=Streptomyces minutiscleroticus TaxID=68238 RepID=UPI00331CFE4D